MFGFVTRKNRDDIHRLFTSRMNGNCLSNINPRDRGGSRSAYSEAVLVIPYGTNGKPEFGYAFPVVSKDISVNGLSLIHNDPITRDPLLVGLPDEAGMSFVKCTLEHCSPLGFGFHQIGLCPEEVVAVNEADMVVLNRRIDQFEHPSAPVLA